MRPVWQGWKANGLPAVAKYWRAFFDAEPGAEVAVKEEDGSVVLDVAVCPAIAHLRKHGREIVPEFCQHCYYVSDAAAEKAGLTVRVEGGAGSCVQTFRRREKTDAPQDLSAIRFNGDPNEPR
ncbi:MAG: hypothetical protein WD342_00380 [Verrucomicrobiales bacterium]